MRDCIAPSEYTVCVCVCVRLKRVWCGAGAQRKRMTRGFTCNRSMWRTCYWHWAFSGAPVGPLNLRGSPLEQPWRAEEFSGVNVQPLLISAEKSHSLNSSPAFLVVERLWMSPQKTANTLPCLLFFSFFFYFSHLGKAREELSRAWELLTSRTYCQERATADLHSFFLLLLLYKFPASGFAVSSPFTPKVNAVPTRWEQRVKYDEIMLLGCFFGVFFFVLACPFPWIVCPTDLVSVTHCFELFEWIEQRAKPGWVIQLFFFLERTETLILTTQSCSLHILLPAEC